MDVESLVNQEAELVERVTGVLCNLVFHRTEQ